MFLITKIKLFLTLFLVDLNPLMKNTNNSGPMDTYEDLDEDGLNNLQEQRMNTNPYKSNKR
jgi:hypothetical protein